MPTEKDSNFAHGGLKEVKNQKLGHFQERNDTSIESRGKSPNFAHAGFRKILEQEIGDTANSLSDDQIFTLMNRLLEIYAIYLRVQLRT